MAKESLNKKFIIHIDCKSTKDVVQMDVKNLASKQIFARWQAILNTFDFTSKVLQFLFLIFLLKKFCKGNHDQQRER